MTLNKTKNKKQSIVKSQQLSKAKAPKFQYRKDDETDESISVEKTERLIRSPKTEAGS